MGSSINKKEKLVKILFLVAVFLFMLVFFNTLHPIVVFDGDDWTYISYTRAALPTTRFFNPSRIFPEIFMSFCGNLAAYVIYPVTGQYMRATTFVMALAYSIFLAAYAWELIRFLQKKFRIPLTATLSVTAIFLVFHFMAFRTQLSGNTYLFWSRDSTCYFYYNIPILMNCILCLRILEDDLPDFRTRGDIFRKSFFIVFAYFTVFSNMFASIITAGFIVAFLLMRLIQTILQKRRFFEFLKENAVPIAIELLWIVSAVLEMLGDRAEEAYDIDGTVTGNVFSNLIDTFRIFKKSLSSMNRILLAFCFLVIVSALVVFCINKGKTKHRTNRKSEQNDERQIHFPAFLLLMAVAFVAVSALLIVLSAASVLSYAGVSTNLLGPLFFLFLAVSGSLAFLVERIPVSAVVLPLLCIVLITLTNTYTTTFIESNDIFIDGDTCIAIGEDLIAQYKEAEDAGLETFELHVLDAGSEGNWPHACFIGDRITTTLLKHGVITRKMNAVLCPDQAFNERYHVTCWD